MSNMMEGVQHNLLGLSPYYWTYLPMLNHDIHSLEVINGVNCYVVNRNRKRKQNSSLESNSETLSTTNNDIKFEEMNPIIIPVTRCELVGTVVNIERRSNGALLYLLDDGTGFVDCLAWEDDFNQASLYYLPHLYVPIDTKGDASDAQNLPHTNDLSGKILVGDLVRIYGKIRCVNRDLEENHTYIREIHVNKMMKIHGRMEWDSEAVHWLECMKLKKRIRMKVVDEEKKVPATLIKRAFTSQNGNEFLSPEISTIGKIFNGSDVLALLGPHHQSVIRDANLLVFDRSISSTYSSFQPNCNCDLKYKDALLYCHCVATKEGLDPSFQFRDALLNHLLILEDQLFVRNKEEQQTSDDESKSQSKSLEKSANRKICRPLHFQYKNILDEKNLFQIAMDIISNPTSSENTRGHTCNKATDEKAVKSNEGISPKESSHDTIKAHSKLHLSSQRRRLYMNTFRCLRKDGILFLLDVDKDEYLLLSRRGILDGYVEEHMSESSCNGFVKTKRSKIENREKEDENNSIMSLILKQTNMKPDFLLNIPYSKLKYVKNDIKAKKRLKKNETIC